MPPEAETEGELVDLELGPVTVHFGDRGGKYPHGNSLRIRGKNESVVIDPSLGLVAREGKKPTADWLLFSHCHEDHIAGAHLYPEIPWRFHRADLPGIQSLDEFMRIYGFPDNVNEGFRPVLEKQFHYMANPAAKAYEDGDVFDLGGVRIRVLHTPGHTRGHSCFLVDWDGSKDRLVYLGDIDLSSFGPYYGDAWSNLEDFERSLERVRGVEARWYATFHHIGVIEGQQAFLEKLARFAGVIQDREKRLLAYLEQPHSIEEIVEHRFIYRPGDAVGFADPVEKRSMEMHLERLIAKGQVAYKDGEQYVSC